MRVALVLISVLWLCLQFEVVVTTQEKQSPPADDKSLAKARELWELAVNAQGGRERLWAIRNMVVSSDGAFEWRGKRNRIHIVTLFAFPNRSWSWNDQRPSHFDLTMSMKNLETKNGYYTSPETEGNSVLKPLLENQIKEHTNFAGLIGELLETKWNQPVPESTFPDKIGKKDVDVVRTSLRGKRIDFALDRSTRLPLRVTAYRDDGLPPARTSMSGYRNFDGIMMPTEVIYHESDGDMKYKISYQFNVEYDESIFEKPPPFSAGPDGWKKK